MWRQDRSTDITTDVTTDITDESTGTIEFTGTMSGDGQGEGRDNVAGLAAANRRIDRRINRRAGHRTSHRTGHRIDRATTSLTPYGMSFWALILAACGGGGGGGGPRTSGPAEKLQREGHVYDGPVKGARVYVDDGDGELPDRDYFVGTTDGRGWFTGSVPTNLVGKRYIVDLTGATDLGDDGREGGTGVNADRGLSGTWLAPEGASVVSALTHLIATGVMTKAQIQSAYPDFDPLVDNPYTQAVAALPPAKQQAFEKIRKALPAITRLVEENRDLINQNSDRIKGLETTIQSLEGGTRADQHGQSQFVP